MHATDATVRDPRRRRAILLATCTALMAVIASASGLNVAQQELALEFHASQSTVLWIINAYILSLAAMLMPMGAIGDRWGRKPVLLAGLAIFGLASVASGLAGSAAFMVATRVAAGVGAAMIMPITLSVITSSFPEENRAQAIGIWTGVAGGGGLIGMLLSALMVDLLDWRWLFALPVALVVAAMLTAIRSVPNSREHTATPFDVGGSVLSMVAVGGLVFGIHEGPGRGWTDAVTLLSLAAGVLATWGFAAWELRHPGPLLDVRVFRDRRLATGSVSLLFLFGVLAGVFIVLFPYFQAVLGWSALRSTAALMPMAVLMMLAAGLAPQLAARVGTRLTMLVGVGLSGAGLALMAGLVSVDGGYASVLPGMLGIGLGMGMTMTPATEAITASLPAERQGAASALNDTTREIGSALGVALLGAVLSSGYREAVGPLLTGVPDAVAELAREGIGSAFAAAAQPGSHAAAVIGAAQEAFVAGWARSMWAGVVAVAVLFVHVAVRGPRSAQGDGAGPADDSAAVPPKVHAGEA